MSTDITLADAVSGPTRVDESRMMSHWVISTSAPDREGDVIEPQSVLPSIRNFSKNPVVLFDHGATDNLPIGVSVGDGRLPLIVEPTRIRASCRHHDLTATSRDVWRLVVAGILKAASIGFLPLESERLGKGGYGELRYRFTSIDTTEWSITPIGTNSEALRIELSAGRIKDPLVRKHLMPFAQRPKAYARSGWDAELHSLKAAVDRRGESLRELNRQSTVIHARLDPVAALQDLLADVREHGRRFERVARWQDANAMEA